MAILALAPAVYVPHLVRSKVSWLWSDTELHSPGSWRRVCFLAYPSCRLGAGPGAPAPDSLPGPRAAEQGRVPAGKAHATFVRLVPDRSSARQLTGKGSGRLGK